MNRVYILITLLVMFLSCGNSSSEAFKNNSLLKMKKDAFMYNLNKAQKVTANKLDAFFSDLNRKGYFNGSVLVSKAGKILYQKAMGIMDKTAHIPLTDSSMFQLAPVSKVITATAVLMLHEREVIDITKSFQTYFPDFQ